MNISNKKIWMLLGVTFVLALLLGCFSYARLLDQRDYSADIFSAYHYGQGNGSICGDGVLDDGEECDDGNIENGDGCSDSCLTEVVDDDDSDEDDVCNNKNVLRNMENVQKKIEKAENAIEKAESQGKDVTKAYESLEEARQELADAEALMNQGDCEGADELAKRSKHRANLAKGKDVLSASPRALVARAFGKCISQAAREKDFAQFAYCHQEFKQKVHDQLEDEMSEEDQLLNEMIEEKIDEYLESVEDEDLRDILEEFRDYNFSGIDAEDLFGEIEAIIDSETGIEEQVAALEDLLESYKEDSAEDKYEDDEIPFTDADDDEWFFVYADILKAEACISGYVNEDGTLTGEFGPGEPVLMGESLKFVLSCIMVEDPAEIGEDDFWALAWAYVLRDEYGEYISEPFMVRVEAAIVDTTLFNEGASRAEIIQLIVDLLAVELPEVTEAPFTDVSVDHPNAAAIAYSLSLGVISGDEETGEFRPDDIPNRAEMVKIIIMAKELM